jgi:hypothetical protein
MCKAKCEDTEMMCNRKKPTFSELKCRDGTVVQSPGNPDSWCINPTDATEWNKMWKLRVHGINADGRKNHELSDSECYVSKTCCESLKYWNKRDWRNNFNRPNPQGELLKGWGKSAFGDLSAPDIVPTCTYMETGLEERAASRVWLNGELMAVIKRSEDDIRFCRMERITPIEGDVLNPFQGCPPSTETAISPESVVQLFSNDGTYERMSVNTYRSLDLHGKGSTDATEIKKKCDESYEQYMTARLDNKSDANNVPYCLGVVVQNGNSQSYPVYDEQTGKDKSVSKISVDTRPRYYMEVSPLAKGSWSVYSQVYGFGKVFKVNQQMKETIARKKIEDHPPITTDGRCGAEVRKKCRPGRFCSANGSCQEEPQHSPNPKYDGDPLSPTTSCYGAKIEKGEPEYEDRCCTCEDVKDAFAATSRWNEKLHEDAWQCLGNGKNNACQPTATFSNVGPVATQPGNATAVGSDIGLRRSATPPATVTQSQEVQMQPSLPNGVGVVPATVPAHVQVPAPPLGIPTEAEIMESRAKHWGSPEGNDSSSTTSAPFNLGHLNFSELDFSGLSGLSGLNINPDGTVNHNAQAQVQVPAQAGIKQPPNGWVSVQAAKRNPDGSWGCKLMADWSSVPKNNEQILQAACKNDPKCVGYYDNGMWLVASNTYPELCDEPGQPEYPYGIFVKNPNVAATGASMTSSVNSMSGVGQGATSPATVTQSQEVQLQLQPSLSNGVGVSTMSGFSPPTAMLDSANAAANGSAIGQINVNDALSGLNRRSATPPTTVAQSQEVQLQPNLSNGFGADTMSGFSPPTAAHDQAVLDSANAAAIGSAIGQMNLNDALSGLNRLTDPQSLAGLVVGDNPGRACTGKMQLRTLDEQSRGDEHENDWRHACVEGCKFDANCQIATVIKNNFTGNLRCVHSAGPVTRDECSGGNGFYTYRK